MGGFGLAARPGRAGGSMGEDAGVLCWAYDADPSSNVMKTETRVRFMGGKSEESSELIGNQDLESAFASGVRTELT